MKRKTTTIGGDDMARDVTVNIYNSGSITVTGNRGIFSISKWPGRNICNLLGKEKEIENAHEIEPGDPEYLPSLGLNERG